MGSSIRLIAFGVISVVLIIALVVTKLQSKKYMAGQRESGSDKKALLDLMLQTLGGEYNNYSYVVGYYTKTVSKNNTTTYYYFPYVLAFHEKELIIYSFIKENGVLHIRNRLPVDFENTKLTWSEKKNGALLKLTLASETMPIHVDPVIVSNGLEKSDRPIGIYQEKEYEHFLRCLPGYTSVF